MSIRNQEINFIALNHPHQQAVLIKSNSRIDINFHVNFSCCVSNICVMRMLTAMLNNAADNIERENESPICNGELACAGADARRLSSTFSG